MKRWKLCRCMSNEYILFTPGQQVKVNCLKVPFPEFLFAWFCIRVWKHMNINLGLHLKESLHFEAFGKVACTFSFWTHFRHAVLLAFQVHHGDILGGRWHIPAIPDSTSLVNAFGLPHHLASYLQHLTSDISFGFGTVCLQSSIDLWFNSLKQ